MADPKKLQVLIVGEAASGKSTVALMLQRALKQAGFEVRLCDEDIDGMTASDFKQWEGLQTMRELALFDTKLQVDIRTKQVRRGSIRRE